jgi:hypothetical protein
MMTKSTWQNELENSIGKMIILNVPLFWYPQGGYAAEESDGIEKRICLLLDYADTTKDCIARNPNALSFDILATDDPDGENYENYGFVKLLIDDIVGWVELTRKNFQIVD